MLTKIFTIISATLSVIALAVPIAYIVIFVFFRGENFMHAGKEFVVFVGIPTFIIMLLLLWGFISLGFKYPYLNYVYCAVFVCFLFIVLFRSFGGDIQKFYFDRKTEIAYKTASKKVNLTISEDTDISYTIREIIADGNLEFVKALVESGLPLNRQLSEYGFTPLLVAAFYGHTEIADYLVKQGANYNLIFNTEQTDSDDVMTLSVKSGNIATVQLFLSLGLNVNGFRPFFNRTPLQIAAEDKEDFEMVKFLIANGADVNKVRISWIDNEEIKGYLIMHGHKQEE